MAGDQADHHVDGLYLAGKDGRFRHLDAHGVGAGAQGWASLALSTSPRYARALTADVRAPATGTRRLR